MITTRIIHHINRDCTHQVIEKLIYLFGILVNRSLTSKLL